LFVFRTGLELGATVPIEARDPTFGIVLVESGTLTVHMEGPVTVTRGAGLGAAMTTAEASGDLRTALEAVAAGQVVTLEAGDAASIPAKTAGELRKPLVAEDAAPVGEEDATSRPATSSADSDADRRADADEAAVGTDANNPDSDGDGYYDGDEVNLGTDALDASSFPRCLEGPFAQLLRVLGTCHTGSVSSRHSWEKPEMPSSLCLRAPPSSSVACQGTSRSG